MSHAKQRLAAAREKIAVLQKKIAAISEQQRQITENAQTAVSFIERPSTQDRVGFLKNMFSSGKPDKASIARMRDEVASHAASVTQQQEIETAKNAAIDELNQEIRAFSPDLQSLGREIAEAKIEAAREEIYEQIVPEFRAACETFKRAYAKLAGAGAAHADLAAFVRTNTGISCQGAASSNIRTVISISAPVLDLGDAANPAVVQIDASALINQHRAAFKESWQ